MTYLEYLRQPAQMVLKWQQMLKAEAEGYEMKRRIEEAQAKARSH